MTINTKGIYYLRFSSIPDSLSPLVDAFPDQVKDSSLGPDRACLEHLPVNHLEQRAIAPGPCHCPDRPVPLPQKYRERRGGADDDEGVKETKIKLQVF